MAKEFKPWLGHVPRDRGSIWYLTPLFADLLLVVILASVVLVAIFG